MQLPEKKRGLEEGWQGFLSITEGLQLVDDGRHTGHASAVARSKSLHTESNRGGRGAVPWPERSSGRGVALRLGLLGLSVYRGSPDPPRPGRRQDLPPDPIKTTNSPI